MLKITHIKRHGLQGEHQTNLKTGRVNYIGLCSFSHLDRINFVRDGLHYSIQMDDIDGDYQVAVRCKEDKYFFKHLGYGTQTFIDLLFGWDWQTKGATYQTFPTDKLEAVIFGGE